MVFSVSLVCPRLIQILYFIFSVTQLKNSSSLCPSRGRRGRWGTLSGLVLLIEASVQRDLRTEASQVAGHSNTLVHLSVFLPVRLPHPSSLPVSLNPHVSPSLPVEKRVPADAAALYLLIPHPHTLLSGFPVFIPTRCPPFQEVGQRNFVCVFVCCTL